SGSPDPGRTRARRLRRLSQSWARGPSVRRESSPLGGDGLDRYVWVIDLIGPDPADPRWPRTVPSLSRADEGDRVVAADWAAMTESVDGQFTVRAVGEIDFANAQHFREYLLGTVSSADRSVRVDLRDVRYLDSSGLHALVTAHAAATRRALRLDV